MINNDMQSVTLLTYASTADEYGQIRKGTPTTTSIQMACYSSITNRDDMLFKDVDLVGITKYSAITDKNVIRIDTVDYNVLQVIPTRRYTEVLLKKVG